VGGVGTVREFIEESDHFISIDPYVNAPSDIHPARKEAYTCLTKPLNFIAANAEFLPFVQESFDWVHMRSMLDHVQVPDLALLEARRVLKQNGQLLIGISVEGGKSGKLGATEVAKEAVKKSLEIIGVDRWKDHHIWHPTYPALKKLIKDNGFTIVEEYWQPAFKDNVCYVLARKS
jgi:ubiquinone/menaquinone biosynthesis C-methylase UbiE